MCGRFAFFAPPEAIAEYFGVLNATELEPRYNVAPTQDVAIVRADADGERRLSMARWGLVPYWAKDPTIGNRMINARAETVDRKPAFREAFRRRRCLVLASGFYEWGETQDGKRPFYVSLKDGAPMAFAGLWERWRKGAEATIESCVIITSNANRLVAPVHERMPVILHATAQTAWLDSQTGHDAALALLAPSVGEDLQLWRVGRAVNNPANESATLIERREDRKDNSA